MKPILLWSLGCSAVILFGLLVKPLPPFLATGLLLAGGVTLVALICLKGK